MKKTIAVSTALLALAVLGFMMRSTGAHHVFSGGNVVFPEFDPYYHMWRVFRILSDFPHVPYFDSYVNYPKGAVIIWPPLFDLFIATLNVLAGFGASDVKQVETLSAYVVPIMGAVTCIPVYFLAREVTGRGGALLAAALITLTPAHIWYSRFGFADHHVAVTLIQILTIYFFLRAHDSLEKGVSLLKSVTFTAMASMALASGFLVWHGYTLMAAILDLYLMLAFWMERGEKNPKAPLLAFATHLPAAAVIAFVASQITADGGAPLTSITLSYFQAGAVGAFGIAGLLAHVVIRLRLERRAVMAMVVPTALIAMALIYLFRGPIGEGLGWLTTKDTFMAGVDESSPPLIGASAIAFAEGVKWGTAFFLSAPLTLAVFLAERLQRWKISRGAAIIFVWGCIMFALAMAQKRFVETFSPINAILAACFIVSMKHWIAGALMKKRSLSPNMAGKWANTIAGALVFVIMTPSALMYTASPESLFAVFSTDESRPPQSNKEYDEKIYDNLLRFRKIVNPGFTKGSPLKPAPEYGIMCWWGIGHKIHYITGMPVVSNNFGSHIGEDSYLDWIKFYFADDEEKASRILQARKIRYVIAEYGLGYARSAATALKFPSNYYYSVDIGNIDDFTHVIIKPPMFKTMFFRLSRLMGSETVFTSASDPSIAVKGLKRFRLAADSLTDEDHDSWKLYEFVKGAKIVIDHAIPDATYNLVYTFTSDIGRKRIYRTSAIADSLGLLLFNVPYSSFKPEFGQTSPYSLLLGQTVLTEISVPEQAVIEGGTVKVSLNK